MVGKAVAMIVESSVSMKSEQATISGTMFFAGMAIARLEKASSNAAALGAGGWKPPRRRSTMRATRSQRQQGIAAMEAIGRRC
ncbi:MAG: hypothetical protein ACREFL_20765 [Stellaceae bacterium]